MDCRTALELLEASRPGSTDLCEPELIEADAHMGACVECEAVFRHRQLLDSEIGEVMRDVEVPEGLKDRVLMTLADSKTTVAAVDPLHDDDASRENSVPGEATRLSRRLWFRAATSVAACLVVGVVGWQLFNASASRIPLEELRRGFVWDVDHLPEFNGNFKAELPNGWNRHHSLRISEFASGVALHKGHLHTSAVYSFVFKSRNRAAIQGRLLVTPRSLFSEPPANSGFSSAEVIYSIGPAGHLETVTWSEGDLVYVCFVRSDIEELRRALQPRLG